MKYFGPKIRTVFSLFAMAMRLGLGCVFLWSSLGKLYQSFDFLSNIYEYELVGPKVGMLAAMVVPWLELILGICLLGGVFLGGALLATIGLCTLFVFIQVSALSRGLAISCGCFSSSDSDLITYGTVIRTGLFLLASLSVYTWLMFRPRPIVESQT